MNQKAEMDTSMNHKAKLKISDRDFPSLFMVMIAVVVVMMLSAVIARTSYAATSTIRPDGVSATGSWSGVTAANLNDQSNATFASNTAVDTFTVSLENDAAYIGATINSVTIWVRAFTPDGTGQSERIDFGPTGALSGVAQDVNRVAFGDLFYSPAGPFVDTDIDNLEIDVAIDRTGGEIIQVSEVWAIVDYTVPCVDPDESILTIANPGASVSNTYRIEMTVAGEANPENLTSVEFQIDGGAWVGATWDGATAWYYDWDTTVETDAAHTVDARGTDPDCSDVVLAPQINITVNNAGAPNTLNSCGDCHTEPPTDGARLAASGDVVGSHASHNSYACDTCHVIPATTTAADYDHRSGTIQMAGSIQGGYYDKNGNTTDDDGPFNQTDSPVLASCENVACHNGNQTPVWGDNTIACDSCHGLPPATNAHNAHYSAKGWTTPDAAATNCTACHPDNTTGAGHSDVTDGNVEVTLTPSGASPAITCGSAPALGCHNGSTTPTTPAWNTSGITCLQCHTVGAVTNTNPTSGLHDEIPTVSGVQHDDTINAAGCQTCHRDAGGKPSSTHVDGTVDTPTDFASAVVTVGYTAGSPATCTASCHSEAINASEAWQRLWHEDSDQSTGAECAGCHGDWVQGWNAGVLHRVDADPRGTHGTGTNYECKDCHALEAAANYDWGVNHANNKITMNNNGVTWGRSGGLSGCSNCHSAYDGTDVATSQHSFDQTGWTPESVTGDTINAGCDSCHGGSGQYWPNGAAYPDTAGRHDTHITKLAAELSITLPGTDAEQKQMCNYCHNDPAGAGGGGHYETPSYVAPADVGGFDRIWDGAADGSASYTAADQTCANACHNGKTTTAGTFGWNDGGASDCMMCHTVGGAGANPNSGLHNLTTAGTTAHDDNFGAGPYGCTDCHQTTPTNAHINGTTNNPNTATFNFDSTGKTITLGTLSDNTDDTCTANCHTDGGAWTRLWSTAADSNATTSGDARCDVCHGQYGSWRAGTSHGETFGGTTSTRGQTHNSLGGVNNACEDCHVYTTAMTNHRNNKITMNDAGQIAETATLANCTATCHSNDGNYATSGTHTFKLSVFAPAEEVPGANDPKGDCIGCHAVGQSGAIVTSASPHTDADGAGAAYDSTNCDACHPGHSGGDVQIPNNALVGINYLDGVSGGGAYSGYAGINLGGSATTKTTEAELCWECHDTVGISEWGKTWGAYQTGILHNGTGSYGSRVTQSNWTTAQWDSANFAYKTEAIQSIHGTATMGASTDSYTRRDTMNIGDIGCSYCHDVHDTKAGSPNGAPYLRGNWTSNPFKEDGAPQTTAHATIHGGVPRAGLGSGIGNPNGIGGWQIEQNNPTAYTASGTYATFAGICAQCHSQTWLEGQAWTGGGNGHAAAVDGFSGSERNVFSTTARGSLGTYNGRANMQHNDTTLGDSKGYLYGLRNDQVGNGLNPKVNPKWPTDAGIANGWGITMDGTTIDSDFHNFPCSKCHNPHASRLPRLMITNCLDVVHNAWDDAIGTDPSTWTGGTYTAKRLAYSPTASNCHRYVDPAASTFEETNGSNENGWNRVTPW